MVTQGVDVSVIVPVYNVATWVGDCIKSILEQSYVSYELVLIDDCSKDNSLEICRHYADLDGRVKVIHLSVNGGVSNARNTGIDAASGQYVCFIDSDDTIHPRFLETLVELGTQYDADISAVRVQKAFNGETDAGVVDFYSDSVSVTSGPDALNQIADYVNPWVGYPFAKLYRRSLLDNVRFNTGISLCEDSLFNAQVFSMAKKVVKSELPLYYYRIREGSATFSGSVNPDKWYTKYQAWKQISFIAEAYPGTEFQIRARRERFIAIVAYAKLLCAAGRSAELKEPAYQKELKESAAGVTMKRVPRNTRIKYLLLRLCLPLFSKIFGAGK